MPYGPTVGDKIYEQVASDFDGDTLNNESAADEQSQQQKHFHEKLPKLEMLKMELKDIKQMVVSTKFGWEKRVLQTELEHQKLLTERNSLLVEMANLKKELQKTADQFAQKQSEQKELCAKWDDLEQKQSADSEKFSKAREEIIVKIDQLAQQLANSDLFKNAFPAKFTAMESFVGVLKDRFGNDLLKAVHPNIRPKIAEIFSNPPPNCWDVNACHSDLTIVDAKCLLVYYKKEGDDSRCVFAKYSVSNTDFGIFYYEVKILSLKGYIKVGFATKETPLDKGVGYCSNSFSYSSVGWFWISGSENEEKEEFGRDDVVGCGINLATGRVILTKNGQPLDTSNLFVSSTDSLFPCVTLEGSGGLVSANFGPNFKFNPSAV